MRPAPPPPPAAGFGPPPPLAASPGPAYRPAPPPAGIPAAQAIVGAGYPKANIGKRLLAYIIDGLIGGLPAAILIPLGVIPFVRAAQMSGYYGSYYSGPGVGTWILFILGIVVGGGWGLFYFLLRDGFGRGQSIGKKAAGLMVVRLADNRPCTKGSSAVRNVFAFLVAVVLGWIPVVNFLAGWAEPIVALIHAKGQRVGDMVAKTQVIEVTEYRG